MSTKTINRRTMLKGVGSISIGLPLLEEMIQPAAAATKEDVPTRAFNIFFGLGIPTSIKYAVTKVASMHTMMVPRGHLPLAHLMVKREQEVHQLSNWCDKPIIPPVNPQELFPRWLVELSSAAVVSGDIFIVTTKTVRLLPQFKKNLVIYLLAFSAPLL